MMQTLKECAGALSGDELGELLNERASSRSFSKYGGSQNCQSAVFLAALRRRPQLPRSYHSRVRMPPVTPGMSGLPFSSSDWQLSRTSNAECIPHKTRMPR
jgi:hypothetical protein